MGCENAQGTGMSLTMARDLVRLTKMATARHGGVTLADISREFGTDAA